MDDSEQTPMTTERGASYLLRFLEAARRSPAHEAVDHNGRVTSYAELVSLTRRMAYDLRRYECLPRVLIHLPQSAEAYAAMFAAAYAGGFYSTTNVAQPPQRRRMTFESFAPTAVITNGELRQEASEAAPGARILTVEELSSAELAEPAPAHRLAYVMFTSGSTGAPKGVMIAQEALDRYVDWALDAMEVRGTDRWSQHPNIAFDLSVLDIYGALCGGATLVPLTDAKDLLMPAHAIRNRGLTIWNSVPSVLTSMIKLRQATPANFRSLRLMTFCGEPLQKMHLDGIFEAGPGLVVHNTYGPTEATVSCTCVRLTAANYRDACDKNVAIGDPIPGMEVALVGPDGPDEGEIVIAGPQVADGYWNDPTSTARQFREVDLGGRRVRGYFTGDWAYRRGRQVYFRGRIDHQVKIRGERIELGDIGAALMSCGYGFACAVTVDGELHGAFESEAALPATEAMREQLAPLLPRHLIPSAFHNFAELPRNANEKVDIAAVRRLIERRLAAG
jgi:D-alanine--poly(phosphoribitol) ligase subunit 1